MTPTIRDKHAQRIEATPGTLGPDAERHVLVIGGGIAGLSAATGLAERGIHVTVAEPQPQLGGRVRSWTVEGASGTVTMSRGFHAFFRQYYNLRSLLERIPSKSPSPLRAVPDYPLRSSDGLADSFAKIPRTPPWSFIGFVVQSPSFRARDLLGVDLDAALSLLDVDFPETYRQHDGQSAQDFLDRLGFPERARHLALEVFARSFFAKPTEFAAGEMLAMFHTYFLGSSEGLLFDTASDDFDTALWSPLRDYLSGLGVQWRGTSVESLDMKSQGARALMGDGTSEDYDAVVLAAGPAATRRLGTETTGIDAPQWFDRMRGIRQAPPFAVWRLWLDRPVGSNRPAFLGTTGFGPLDNVSVLERFETGAARWSEEHGGSVVELHAYALDEPVDEPSLQRRLRDELSRVYPETRTASIMDDVLLIENDCPLVGLEPWEDRPEVRTPHPSLVLAGDTIRCEYPVALMERAATTGWQAANALLEGWAVQGHELWTPPLASRHAYPRTLRKLLDSGRRARRLVTRGRPRSRGGDA
ncbi:FAD-dependent oxidoreductase [Rothia uropygioeca]|uniref:FAD-dependent oxidoreductase n=1 Tax=Kocuria sp. 257 TaxID=2021970 RepID=UPI0010133AE0|nr:FAD-dependent oxidoreductase [Kocuria sp. 257]